MDIQDVVYVEDDEQEAFIMRVGMRRQGINILHVQTMTPQMLFQLQDPPYDTATAVIFDAILPGHSGVDLAQQLRTSGDGRLIILLTAAENPDPELLTNYNIRYMRKPPDFERLAAIIHQHSSDSSVQ